VVSRETDAVQAEISARTFRLVLYDALASEAMGALTTGVFLVGFAVELGASNFAIGLLASVRSLFSSCGCRQGRR
jgi:hypothetical protein